MEKPKVLILTEGGGAKGFGHITRCLSLYQAFTTKSVSCLMVVDGDDMVKRIMGDIDFEIVNWREEKKFLGFTEVVDVVVVDSYLAKFSVYKAISDSKKRAVYFDDCNRLDYPRSVVLNGNIFADRLGYNLKNGNKYLLGQKYIALRKEFLNIPKKKIGRTIKKILITFGGKRYYGLVEEIGQSLKNKFGFVVDSLGLDFNAQQMLDTMLNCDVCICGGGQTLNELARVGVPAVGICFADNQDDNLKAWQEKGFARYAGRYTDAKIGEKIGEILANLGYERRCEMSRMGCEFVDGRGASRIVDTVLNLKN